MLYNLLAPYSEQLIFANLFRYITFRSGGAMLTALVVSFVLGPTVIAWLRSKQRDGQPIRTDGPPEPLLTKNGTPYMGGELIKYEALGLGHKWVNQLKTLWTAYH